MFFRIVGYLLAAVILITVLRSVIGFFARLLANFIAAPAQPRTTSPPPATPETPVSGELKKDPVCGVYVPASSAVKKQLAGGRTVHFCSEACRDKYAG